MKKSPPILTRREATQSILLALGGAFMAGCGGTSTGDTSDAGTGDDTTPDSGAADAGTVTAESGTSGGDWATGGTKAMTSSSSYPNPFATASTACILAVNATEGPCTEAADQVRKDVSEGYTGLPMRLALRVVDASCKPIAGAKVKIWHTQINGSYSGDTPNAGMCLKDQSDAAKHYFRGAQTTDADGRVDFDSCFPGWYRGRAIHIHWTVSLNGKTYTSQIGFDQALINEIFTTHPEYKGFGTPDTPNASDNILGGSKLSTYIAKAERMSDGAMLASKELVVDVA